MRELFFKLFEMSHFNTGIKITAFSLSHLVYVLLITGVILGFYFAFKNKEEDKKTKLLRGLAYALVISYLSDFFVHDFVYGGLNMDKLPFHICTVLCPLVCFVQFNKKFQKIAEPVCFLAIVAPLMYLTYPASVGDGEPWCYQAVQTMFYHGALLAWGILSIALGSVKPELKNCYKAGILLVVLTLWAKLGNVLLDYNWFFLKEDAFYIGLVGNGIIPQWSLMVFNPIAFFITVLAVYGLYYAIKSLALKFSKNNK